MSDATQNALLQQLLMKAGNTGLLNQYAATLNGRKTSGGAIGTTPITQKNQEVVWQDWLTLQGNLFLMASGTQGQVPQAYSNWLDMEGLDSVTVTANIRHASGTGLKLILGTAQAPGGPFTPIVDFVAEIGLGSTPGSHSVNLVVNPGHIRIPDNPPGTPLPTALGRYLTWAVAPPPVAETPASVPWALSFQLVVTPKGGVTTPVSVAKDRFMARDIQPYTAIRARGFATATFGTSPRVVTQSPSMWLDTRNLRSLGLTIDTLLVDGGALHIQTAYTADQVEWTDALVISAFGGSGNARFQNVYLTRDDGASTKTLQNFLRWQLIQTSAGTSTIVTAYFRITGGGSR